MNNFRIAVGNRYRAIKSGIEFIVVAFTLDKGVTVSWDLKEVRTGRVWEDFPAEVIRERFQPA